MSQDVKTVEKVDVEDPGEQPSPCLRFKLYSLGYFRTLSGILHCFEVVLAMVAFSLLLSKNYICGAPILFLSCVAFHQWIGGLYFLVAVLKERNGSAIQSSVMWLMYHGLGSFFFTIGAVACLTTRLHDDYQTSAAILGLIAVIPLTWNFLMGFRMHFSRKDNLRPVVTGGCVIETKISYFKLEDMNSTFNISNESMNINSLDKV